MADDFDPAATANFPLEEASDWIARWRAVGGGFFCRVVEGGVEVQLARHVSNATVDPDAPPVADIFATQTEKLQSELLASPRVKAAVMTLVSQQWQKAVMAADKPAGSC